MCACIKIFKFYEFDLASENRFSIQDRIDCILHLAGIVSGSANKTEDYMRANVLGTNKLIILQKKKDSYFYHGKHSIRLRTPAWQKLVETDKLLGNTDYAISKIDAESLVQNSGLETYTIFRIALFSEKIQKDLFLN